MPVAVSGSQP